MFPAHIRETGERQTVQEHCRNTAALAATALRPLGLEKSAYLVGLLHDAGKNKQEYAQYLSEAVSGGNAVRGSVNHTFAGVRLLLDRWHGGCGTFSYSDVTAELLAFAVGSHHGLFDCIDPQQHSGFFHRQTKEGIFYDESRQGFLAEVADEEELERLFRDAVREMTPMLDRLAAFPRKTPIDLARHTISDTCAAGAARPGGVYRLNVPTGGGKTLASLRFALTHAAKWNCSRIIFTAPLLSILDQNAQVIRDYIGDDALIVEHHSNLAEPKETPERLQALELLTASWSAPIIITTLVQLLNTCFSGRTSAIRRFHALCGSVIVIDEVQTVPGKMLTLFNLAVNFLSEGCGATIVLCSATQPCLEAADHPLHRQPVDLVPQQKALWDIFKRTDIQNAGCARLEELPQIVMGALSSCDSLLVVCNTKKEAAFLFESLQAENCRFFHLSAAMCMQHRRETLQALQSALDKPSADRQRVVCVSTQVIEAGVDISFQRVIRFSAGMDSVVQAAGRCNRHAEQKKPAPVRLIRCTDERLRGLDDIVRGQNATTALLTAFSKTPEAFRHDLSSEEAIRFYYRRLYAEMEPGFQDDQTQAHGSLYHLLADNPRYADANCAQAERYLLRQAFRLAGSLFQVFDEDTRSLLVPYGKGRELQNTLRNAAQVYGQKDWAVIRGCIDGAKGYCVSVYRYQLERLESLGAVISLFDGGILLLSDGFYNEHTGFSLEAGTRDFQEV